MVTNKGQRKTVYFGDTESKILKYALEQNSNFANYIKDLIKKDMQREPLEKTVIKIVEDYLKDKQLSINDAHASEDTTAETEFNEDDIKALNKLMGRS